MTKNLGRVNDRVIIIWLVSSLILEAHIKGSTSGTILSWVPQQAYPEEKIWEQATYLSTVPKKYWPGKEEVIQIQKGNKIKSVIKLVMWSAKIIFMGSFWGQCKIYLRNMLSKG